MTPEIMQIWRTFLSSPAVSVLLAVSIAVYILALSALLFLLLLRRVRPK